MRIRVKCPRSSGSRRYAHEPNRHSGGASNHSGFHVHIGERIQPNDEQGLENLARYIIRACFSQERMVYIPVAESTDGVAKVIYTSKDGRTRKTFNALDWLAHLVTHVPGRYEQTVRYYGYYSNKSSVVTLT